MKKAKKKSFGRVQMRDCIEDGIAESAFVKLVMVKESVPELVPIAQAMVSALRKNRRLFFFGNGGSAADAQHLSGELEGRLRKDRRALPALALTTNSSTMTAVSNDYDFEESFSRQVEAHVRRGDVVVAISTSGNSLNVLKGLRAAKKAGAVTVALTGRDGGKLARGADFAFKAPVDDTQRAQECHILAGHVLCDVVERALFP